MQLGELGDSEEEDELQAGLAAAVEEGDHGGDQAARRAHRVLVRRPVGRDAAERLHHHGEHAGVGDRREDSGEGRHRARLHGVVGVPVVDADVREQAGGELDQGQAGRLRLEVADEGGQAAAADRLLAGLGRRHQVQQHPHRLRLRPAARLALHHLHGRHRYPADERRPPLRVQLAAMALGEHPDGAGRRLRLILRLWRHEPHEVRPHGQAVVCALQQVLQDGDVLLEGAQLHQAVALRVTGADVGSEVEQAGHRVEVVAHGGEQEGRRLQPVSRPQLQLIGVRVHKPLHRLDEAAEGGVVHVTPSVLVQFVHLAPREICALLTAGACRVTHSERTTKTTRHHRTACLLLCNQHFFSLSLFLLWQCCWWYQLGVRFRFVWC